MEQDNEITTLRISKKTIERLEKLKIHPRQALEEVIINLLGSDKRD